MNGGDGGQNFVEIDGSQIRNKPGYNIHTTSASLFTAASIGKKYAFKVEAYNVIGNVFSIAGAHFTLADLPKTPTLAPISDESITNDKRVKLDITPVAPGDNGGSPITSYSLEMDDGQGGQFLAIYGKDVDSLATSFTLYTNV